MPRKVTRGPSPSPGTFSDLGRLILDRIDRGVFALAEDGRLADANAEGRALLRGARGVRLREGRLRFADPELDAALADLLRRAASSAPRGFARRMKVRGSADVHRVLATPVPLDVRDKGIVVLVFVYAAVTDRRISPELVEQLYGLSRAQARVVAKLYECLTVDATASALGLSANTVRTHLKRTFDRCQVHSQAELMQLLAMGPRSF